MDGVINLLLQYSYLVLFAGVVIEGEIFPLAAGALVSLGEMNLYLAILVTFGGAFIGDILWFLAARHWGARFVERFGRLLFLKRARLEWLEEHFRNNGKKTLFVTKFIYTFGHSSIIVAGVAKMPFRDFIKVDLIASLIWAGLFVFLGYFFGSGFSILKHALRNVTWAAIIILVTIIILQFFVRKKFSKEV
jgi:membrane protein DedA with SNARE-associated domain